MNTLLLILGPGSFFTYLMVAATEFYLTFVFDKKYFLMGKAKSFNLNPEAYEKISSKNIEVLSENLSFVKLPIGLLYCRMITKDGMAQIKMPYFLWIAQPFILFTALLSFQQGALTNPWLFIGGCEFLFAGLHLNIYSKVKQLKEHFILVD